MTKVDLGSTNNPAIVIGRKAGTMWQEASKYGDGGDALATEALYQAQRMLTFHAVVHRAGEDIEERFEFDVTDLANPIIASNGKRDNKAMTARTVAVAEQLFGFAPDTAGTGKNAAPKLSNAMKQRIDRAADMAIYLINRHADMEDKDYLVRRDCKDTMTTCLVVPYGAVVPEPAKDADEDDVRRYRKLADEPQTLDGSPIGKIRASLAELKRRATPATDGRGGGANAPRDKGKTFLASVDFIAAVVKQQLDPNADETDIALSDDVRRKLFDLQMSIAAYFDDDPLEVKEEKKAKEKKAA
jgi:hypothetical protein